MLNKRKEGYLYEREIADWLKGKGYKILIQNYQASNKEIDLIAKKNDLLVVVEVKHLKSRSYQNEMFIHSAISMKKQKNIFFAINHFLKSNPQYQDYIVRFDAVLVLGTIPNLTIWHYEDAFRQ